MRWCCRESVFRTEPNKFQRTVHERQCKDAPISPALGAAINQGWAPGRVSCMFTLVCARARNGVYALQVLREIDWSRVLFSCQLSLYLWNFCTWRKSNRIPFDNVANAPATKLVINIWNLPHFPLKHLSYNFPGGRRRGGACTLRANTYLIDW